jgi:hypothetical protein
VRDCRSCARLYQRFVEAERALCGTPELSILQRDRIEGRLIAPRPRRSLVLPIAIPVAAALVVALLFIAPSDEFSPRGERALSHAVELRALAVEPQSSGGFSVHPASDRTLGPGDHLRLLYQNQAGFDRVTVEIAGADRRVVLLSDHPIERSDRAKLGEPIAVGDWPAGEVQIRATFCRDGHIAPADARASDGDGWAIRTVRTRVEAR